MRLETYLVTDKGNKIKLQEEKITDFKVKYYIHQINITTKIGVELFCFTDDDFIEICNQLKGVS